MNLVTPFFRMPKFLPSARAFATKPTIDKDLPKITEIMKYHKDLRNFYKHVEDPNEKLPLLKSKGHITVLNDPKIAFLKRVQLIREAKESIDFSTFLFANDDIGYALLNELREAVKRGVVVHLLVDSMGSIKGAFNGHNEFKALMHTQGKILDPTDVQKRSFCKVVMNAPFVNVSEFLKGMVQKLVNIIFEINYPLSYVSFNHRMHDKLMIVDGRSDGAFILGGRNIANNYFPLTIKKQGYKDMEVLCRFSKETSGSVTIGDIASGHFDRIFLRKGNNKLTKNAIFRITPSEYRAEIKKMKMAHKKLKSILDETFETKEAPSTVTFLDEFLNIAPNSSIEKDITTAPNSILYNIKEACKEAQDSIEIVSPFPYLKPSEIDFLTNWLKENNKRKLRIISNSILSVDENIFGINLFDKTIGAKFAAVNEEMKKQIELHCYGRLDTPNLQGRLHGKFVLIDQKMAFIMSSNLNPRSRHLDSEIALKIEASASMDELKKTFDEIASQSHLWGGEEWSAIRNHPHLKSRMRALSLGNFLYPLIKNFI